MRKFGRPLLWSRIFLLMAALFFLIPQTYAQDAGIARLDSFSGKILLKSKGIWAPEAKVGMLLYHGDKILTKDGTCTIRFQEGSVLDISENSVVRICQRLIKKGVFTKKLVKERELRVLLGKVKYKSGENPPESTLLVAPTAVAALRGTEVEFGTDGNLAFINQIDGGYDIQGNITEGIVPGVDQSQSDSNSNYKIALKAWSAQQDYNDIIQAIIRKGGMASSDISAKDLLLASKSKFVNALILAQANEMEGCAGDNLILIEQELDALNSLAAAQENESENGSLTQNPDEDVAERAADGLDSSREAITEAQAAYKLAKENACKVQALAQRAQSGDRASREALDAAIDALNSSIDAYNDLASNKTALSEIVTIGQDETLINQTANMAAKAADAAEQAADDAAKAEEYANKAEAAADPATQQAYAQAAEYYAKSSEANAALASAALDLSFATLTGNTSGIDQAMNDMNAAQNSVTAIEANKPNFSNFMTQLDEGSVPTENIEEELQNFENMNNEADSALEQIPNNLMAYSEPQAPPVGDLPPAGEEEEEMGAPEGTVPQADMGEDEGGPEPGVAGFFTPPYGSPNPVINYGLSQTQDRDGDGIPDELDPNPSLPNRYGSGGQ